MNPIKAAAIIALAVTIIAVLYLSSVFYENEVLLKPQSDAVACVGLRLEHGSNYPCEEDNSALRYGISGGVALIGLITSLVLFGVANPRR